MGAHKNISYKRFPKQGDWLGLETKVCFHYNTDRYVKGTIIREDMEEPYITIILLEDGRVILAKECQYQPLI